MNTREQQVRRALLDYGYQHLGAAILGSSFAAAILTAVLLHAAAPFGGWTWAWLSLQLVSSSLGMGIRHSYANGAWLHAPRRALLGRRSITWGIGLAWGSAGYVWSDLNTEAGLACVLCIAGLSAAASLTSAADPPGVWLFTVPALAPCIAMQAPDHGWLSALLFLFCAVITVVCYRVRFILEHSLTLRFDNDELLARAIEDRRATECALQQAVQAVAARNQFLASVAHDLRQPLQALVLFAEVLTQPSDEGRRNAVVAAVSRTTQSLNSTVESLLSLSRSDPSSGYEASAARTSERESREPGKQAAGPARAAIARAPVA